MTIRIKRERMRDVISALYLLAPPPGATVIPEGFPITTVGERAASNTKGRKWSGEAGPMSSRAHGAMYIGAKIYQRNRMR